MWMRVLFIFIAILLYYAINIVQTVGNNGALCVMFRSELKLNLYSTNLHRRTTEYKLGLRNEQALPALSRRELCCELHCNLIMYLQAPASSFTGLAWTVMSDILASKK